MPFEQQQELQRSWLTPDNRPFFSGSKVKQITLYKTEYCRNWAELGHCRYGKKCRYAHGESELRPAPRHGRYKTQICRAYHFEGTCPYGTRCTFIHDIGEKETQNILPCTNSRNFGSSIWNSKLGLASDHHSDQQHRNSLGSSIGGS